MELVFMRADEVVVVKIIGTNVNFSNEQVGFQTAVPIESLRLDTSGILREFPDLKNLSPIQQRQMAIERFRQKIRDLGGENERKKYLIDEFANMGYSLKLIKKEGFRDEKIKVD